jgi:hypothetical protein
MAPVLRELLGSRADTVRFELRHAPLPVHRDARAAAVAAECALEQGIFWPFHDALLDAPEPLDAAGRARLAETLGADRGAFEACLARGSAAARVDADRALATGLGVRVAPTFFVNERRLDGPQTLDALERAIAGELEAAREPAGPAPQAAPTNQPPAAAPTPPAPATRPPRERVVHLDRAEVARALADRTAFAAQTELAPLDVEGHRLVRLARVPEAGLLAQMQLEPRDLLMQLDGVWIVDRVDPLADALLTRDRVRLTIIRRGFPKTFVYAIDETE